MFIRDGSVKVPPFKGLAAIVCALSVLFLAPIPSTACECVTEGQRHAFRRARYVFVGTVLSSDSGPTSSQEETDEGFCFRRVRMKIDTLYKGNSTSEITVEACGIPGCYPRQLLTGRRYLIYAFGSHLRVLTSACTRVRLVSDEIDPEVKQELKRLGQGRWRFTTRVWPFWREY
jgi:hypothetical protein